MAGSFNLIHDTMIIRNKVDQLKVVRRGITISVAFQPYWYRGENRAPPVH